MTPALTVVVNGALGSSSTELTLRSVRSSHYQGPVQVLVDDGPFPGISAIGQASGELTVLLPAGTMLDRRCLSRLVARAVEAPNACVVVPEVRRPDGRPLLAGLHVEPSRPTSEAAHSGVAHRAHHPIDVTASCIMLVRTDQLQRADRFDDGLSTSPFQAAALVLQLSGPDTEVIVDDAAVAYAPPSTGHPDRRPGYELFRPGGLQPDGRTPEDGAAVLWIAPHLPDRTRSGGDARLLEMIEATASGGTDVTLWAQHGGDAGASGDQLAEAGAHWVAPVPFQRWGAGPAAAPFHVLDELLAEQTWSALVVAEPGLVAPVARRARALAPGTPIVADLRTVRFPAAHRDEHADNDPAVRLLLDAIAGAGGIVAATHRDAAAIRSVDGQLPVFVFTATGRSEQVEPAADGRPLFVGDLLHHPNVQALEWWVEELAGRVFARAGRPVILRAVGSGAEAYRRTWDRPDKVEIGGWQPDLVDEYRRARLLVVPLPYPTGTGGRVASALRAGLPVVASASAAAVVPRETARLLAVGRDAGEIADHVARLATDDRAWDEARRRIAAATFDPQEQAWNSWWQSLPPRRDDDLPGEDDRRRRSSRRPDIRRALRRPVRSS